MSEVNLVKSMHSGLQEHVSNSYGPNTVHLASEIILYRILGFYYERVTTRGSSDCKRNSELSIPFTMLTFNIDEHLADDDLGALIVMALFPRLFQPQDSSKKDSDVAYGHMTNCLLSDRRDARFHAVSLLKCVPHLIGTVHGHLKHIYSSMSSMSSQDLFQE